MTVIKGGLNFLLVEHKDQTLFVIALVCGIIGISIVVVGVIGLALGSSDSDNEPEEEEKNTEFETYTNADYGFSIDFPSDWQKQESNLQEYEVVHFLSPEDIAGAVNIFVIEVPPGLGFYDMVNNAIEQSDYRLISMTNATIAGLPAVEEIYYQYEFGSTTKTKEALILNNLDLIMIRYIAEPENFEEYLLAFDHMLQSFRVI